MRSEAPVKIWHKILKYAISVSLFFDPNPADTYGIDSIAKYSSYEFLYWESERIRYSLRTVCKGWDSFLQQYAHRYVKMTDIYHDRIPGSVLPLAIRVDLTPDTDCQCYRCRNIFELGTQRHLKWIGYKMMRRLEEAISLVHNSYGPTQQWNWNTEILQGCLAVSERDLEVFEYRAPGLAVLIQRFDPIYAFNTLSSNLRVLTNEVPLDFRNFGWCLSSPTLTTLYLRLRTIETPIKDWQLPSLKHFAIETSTESFNQGLQEKDNLLEILEVLGQNLETMHFRSKMKSILVPEKLWVVCPKLLRVQMPYKWRDIPHKAHPVRFFMISAGYLAQETDSLNTRDYLPKPLSDGVSKCDFEVRLDVPWSKVTFFSDIPTLQMILLILEEYAPYEVELKDYEGTSFQDFIVSVLRYYWKCSPPKRQRRYPRVEPLYF
jgi:hypothetical protein